MHNSKMYEYLHNGFLEHSVGGRIGDHSAGQVALVLVGQIVQLIHVDKTVLEHIHLDDLHAGHGGARRIRAVSRCGYQTHLTTNVTCKGKFCSILLTILQLNQAKQSKGLLDARVGSLT